MDSHSRSYIRRIRELLFNYKTEVIGTCETLKYENARARERPQCLRTLTALPEDLGLRMCTHKAAYNAAVG